MEIQESGNIVHDMYLEVPTTAEKNGTSVQCAVLVDVLQISENVTLIVQGKLLTTINCSTCNNNNNNNNNSIAAAVCHTSKPTASPHHDMASHLKTTTLTT